MQTIRPIQTEDATSPAREFFKEVESERGTVPNMLKIMAQSPAVLEGYLHASRALNSGELPPKLRTQIALAVAQVNHCEYSLAQYATIAGQLGLTTNEIVASREAHSPDKKTDAALKFARDLAAHSSEYSTWELRQAGYEEAEIVGLVALVSLNAFENYLNKVARTELDFPALSVGVHAA